ncbi:MAG TPA: hypothetical protein DC054_11095 [Blastocatellia bacterium]|nr:hypothetical protein [Blastocatellia bacterium]
MSLNYLDALILIAINQGNADSTSTLAKSLATDEDSIRMRLSGLEVEGFLLRQSDAVTLELSQKGRDYLIEHDMYRVFRLVKSE